MNNLGKVMSDPWSYAYLCSINKCSLDDAVKALETLLLSRDDQAFRAGLELLRALKSLLEPSRFLYVVREVLKRSDALMDKLLESSEPDRILSSFNRDYNYALGLITLLQLYPFMNKYDELVERLKYLVSNGFKKLGSREVLEFYNALIHGPVTSLPVKMLDNVLREFDKLPSSRESLLVRAELLKNVLENYPPQLLVENSYIFDTLNHIFINVVNETLSLAESDLETVLRIVSDLNIYQYRLSTLSYETKRYEIYEEFKRRAGSILDTLYSLIGFVKVKELDNS